MKAGLTEIICIIDKSGSMRPVCNDAIGSFNTFLAEQRKLPGQARLTLTLFDTQVTTPFNGVDIRDMPDLSVNTYNPDGNTAMLMAICETIDTVGRRLAETVEDEKPEKVIVVILTDGEENASPRQYTRQVVKDKIEHQRTKYSWEFVFLAANQDACLAGQSIGVVHNHNYDSSSGEGMRQGVMQFCSAVSHYRTSGHVD